MTHYPSPVNVQVLRLLDPPDQRQHVRAEERALLAQELHDELGALLMAAKLHLASLQVRCASMDGDVRRRFERLAELLDAGLAFKTRVVDGLQPAGLLEQGLPMALEHMARDFERSTDIAIQTHLEEVDLDSHAQRCIYRLVQECLTNIGKHAHATQVSIEMRGGRRRTTVAVSDNGIGFDPGHIAPLAHGLAGMRNRIKEIQGQVSIDSATGKGTRLVAMLPRLDHPRRTRARRTLSVPSSEQ